MAHIIISLTLSDLGFFHRQSSGGGGGGGMRARHRNFVVIAPMIMKYGTGIKLDVLYTIGNKKVCDVTIIT